MSAMMMKSRSLMATARPSRRSCVVVKADLSTEITPTQQWLKEQPGVSEPFPNVFDPLNLATKAPLKDVKRWRESEIVHGRVAMLASLGFVVGEQLEDFPAFMNFDGSITGPAINQFQQVRQGFWEPLLICIGLAESYRVALGWATPVGGGFNALKDEYNPGELGFDPLGIAPKDPAEFKEMQTKEINNGRLAMIAIAAFTAQELVDQREIFEHLFLRGADEVVKELDVLERDVGLPETPVPFPGY